jgi:hypothetical protein
MAIMLEASVFETSVNFYPTRLRTAPTQKSAMFLQQTVLSAVGYTHHSTQGGASCSVLNSNPIFWSTVFLGKLMVA